LSAKLSTATLIIANSNGDTIASKDNWMDGPDAETIMADDLAPT
jgi:hypothetical protein